MDIMQHIKKFNSLPDAPANTQSAQALGAAISKQLKHSTQNEKLLAWGQVHDGITASNKSHVLSHIGWGAIKGASNDKEMHDAIRAVCEFNFLASSHEVFSSSYKKSDIAPEHVRIHSLIEQAMAANVTTQGLSFIALGQQVYKEVADLNPQKQEAAWNLLYEMLQDEYKAKKTENYINKVNMGAISSMVMPDNMHHRKPLIVLSMKCSHALNSEQKSNHKAKM